MSRVSRQLSNCAVAAGRIRRAVAIRCAVLMLVMVAHRGLMRSCDAFYGKSEVPFLLATAQTRACRLAREEYISLLYKYIYNIRQEDDGYLGNCNFAHLMSSVPACLCCYSVILTYTAVIR